MTYLDNAASTIPRFFSSDYCYNWFNPNSNHKAGLQAKQDLDDARNRIKAALGLKSGKVIFCRCATEAVEWLCRYFRKQSGLKYNVQCSMVEHDSVFYNCYYRCHPNDMCFFEEDSLYLHQFCSHLTGQIFDIESIGKQVQSTGAFFGTDITAGLGKYKLPNNLEDFCDALWFSGRKIRCETMGALWLSDRLFDYLDGRQDSKNEYSLLHGTPNVSGAIALSHAVEHAVENIEQNQVSRENLLMHLWHRVCYDIDKDCNIWHMLALKTDAINALYLPGFNADVLVQFLSSRDIYVSPCYSACSEDADYRVALALGMTKEEASQTIRVSFGAETTEQDIDVLVDAIVEFKELFM